MPHQLLQIRTDDGTCPADHYTPEGAGPWPGVLMYMDGLGMRPALREMAARLSAAGYEVLLPDLFYRIGAYEPADPKRLFSDDAYRGEWFKKVFTSTSQELCMRDTRAFLDVLKQPHIGVTGYCMGGRMSLSAAAHFPDRIVAAAAFHPGGLATDAPDSPHLGAPKIRAVVYVAGAMEDQSFPDAQKERLEQALTAAGVDHVVETYPAKHGWVPSDTPVHDATQAERHWTSLFGLFQKTLLAPG
jgi:carboxymethylenebutenolidase